MEKVDRMRNKVEREKWTKVDKKEQKLTKKSKFDRKERFLCQFWKENGRKLTFLPNRFLLAIKKVDANRTNKTEQCSQILTSMFVSVWLPSQSRFWCWSCIVCVSRAVSIGLELYCLCMELLSIERSRIPHNVYVFCVVDFCFWFCQLLELS
jgi:hypothetical protein